MDTMKFPPHVHREYPKSITLPNGKKEIVQNAHEEMLALSPQGEAPVVIISTPFTKPVEVVIETVQDIRVDLESPQIPAAPTDEIEEESDTLAKSSVFARADELGVIYDKRWSVRRIMEAIAEAEKIVIDPVGG